MSFKPYLAVSASAGSGKTFALSARYVALLFMGVDPSQILAATFTKKAALEMQQRVASKLLSIDEDEAFLEAVASQASLTHAELKAKAPAVRERFLSSRSYIVTLDSFFINMLRGGIERLGIQSGFVMGRSDPKDIEQSIARELEPQSALLMALLEQLGKRRFGDLLEILEWFYPQSPMLPSALKQCVDPKIFEEPIEELRASIYEMLQSANASTSALNMFLAKEPLELTLLSWPLSEHRYFKKPIASNANIATELDRLEALLVSYLKSRGQQIVSQLLRLNSEFYKAKKRYIQEHSKLDFVDASVLLDEVMNLPEIGEFLYFKLDTRFSHILLDEYQDTSLLQYRLLRPLIEEIKSGKGQHDFKSFFYVGDTKQSIYRFRGGLEQLFGFTKEDFEIELSSLTTNYRSSKAVVEGANSIFAKQIDGYEAQKVRSGASEGYSVVSYVEHKSDELFEEVANQVEALCQKGANSSDIAVLVYTNSDAQKVRQACSQRGYDATLFTSSKLHQHALVVSVVQMLQSWYTREPFYYAALAQMCHKSPKDFEVPKDFKKSLSPFAALVMVIEHFGCYAKERSLLALLEFSLGFEDIESFIEEFWLSDISTLNKASKGVVVMTIHGSKGLEFEHVIVMDKSTKEKADTSPFMAHLGEDLSISALYYRFSSKQRNLIRGLDRGFHSALSAYEEAAAKENLNLFYVAATRAKEGISFIAKNEKSRFSFGEHFAPTGEILFEPRPQLPQESPREPMALSPLGAQQKPEASSAPVSSEAVAYGIALHHALEMMVDFEPEAIANAIESTRNHHGSIIKPQGIARIQSALDRVVAYTPFKSLLVGATLYKEQSLVIEGEFRQIDLLLEYEEHLLIIDYKSSKKFAQKHKEQVSSYCKAMEKILHKPANGALLYITDEGVEIDFLN